MGYHSFRKSMYSQCSSGKFTYSECKTPYMQSISPDFETAGTSPLATWDPKS